MHCAAVACGVVVSLCVTGYTFLQSNQHVYLLDALFFQRPETLARDWFTTHTLQYHVVYTHLTVLLEQLHVLAGGFFALYLACAIGLHVAWRSVARSLGGDDRSYLLSVVFYHLSAAGWGSAFTSSSRTAASCRATCRASRRSRRSRIGCATVATRPPSASRSPECST